MSPASSHDRRRHRRQPATELPSLSARLVGGSSVRLLDVSVRGVRLETTSHMRPGQTVSIRFVAADAMTTLSGAVVRASVARLEAGAIWYDTALSLSTDFELCEQLAPETGADAELAAATEPPADEIEPTTNDAALAGAPFPDYTVIVDASEEARTVLDGLRANRW